MSALLYCFDLFLTTPLITHNYQKVCENYECYKIIKAYLFSSLFHFLVLFFKGCHLTFQTTDAKKTSDLNIARERKPHNVRDKNLFPVVVPLCVCGFSFFNLIYFVLKSRHETDASLLSNIRSISLLVSLRVSLLHAKSSGISY